MKLNYNIMVWYYMMISSFYALEPTTIVDEKWYHITKTTYTTLLTMKEHTTFLWEYKEFLNLFIWYKWNMPSKFRLLNRSQEKLPWCRVVVGTSKLNSLKENTYIGYSRRKTRSPSTWDINCIAQNRSRSLDTRSLQDFMKIH